MAGLKCLVCGIEIKKENYNVNSKGRLTENLIEDIKCCPFCGVGIDHLSSEIEPYFEKVENLDEISLNIIDHAMKLEVFNGEFYKKASMMAKNEKVKNMFKDLSRVEFMHAQIHKKLGGFKELPVLKDIDYSKLDSDELLIDAANKREKHAVAYYDRYMGSVKDENIVSVFKALSEVEKEHIEMTA